VKLFVFLREVKFEAGKISWPSQKEVGMIGVLVMSITVLASLFFLMTDAVVYKCIQFILGI
jgi:preprotein translocase subunit SecE